MALGYASLPLNPAPSSMSFRYQKGVRRFQSRFSGDAQKIDIWGRWVASMTWDLLEPAQAQPLVAFLTNVGESTPFFVYDVSRDTPLGTATDSDGVVKDTGATPQTGTSLQTVNWGVSTVVLKKGDLIGIRSTGELYEVAADVTPSTGNATIALANPIRRSPENNEAIRIGAEALCVMTLTRPYQRDVVPPRSGSISIEMEEYLGVEA